jgi:3-methylfumaryl-CoA hydratase
LLVSCLPHAPSTSPTMTDAPHEFSDWIGRTETVHDGLSVEHARAAAAMFDDANVDVRVGAPLQPLWNWFFFLSTAQQSALDVDGHPKRGGFFPPIPLDRDCSFIGRC